MCKNRQSGPLRLSACFGLSCCLLVLYGLFYLDILFVNKPLASTVLWGFGNGHKWIVCSVSCSNWRRVDGVLARSLMDNWHIRDSKSLY